MNLRNTMTASALIVGLAGASASLTIAQQTQPVRPDQPAQPGSRDWNTQDRDRAEQKRMKLETFTTLKGSNIYNTRGDTIGSIDDLVLMGAEGKIDRAVVKTGAILGVGGKTVAVPFSQLTWNAENERFVLSTNADDLKRLPEFDPDTILNDPNNRRDRAPTQRPGTAPGTAPGMAPSGESADYDRSVVLASTVQGADIMCAANECGKVHEIIVDIPSRRAVLISIDPNQNFLGIGDVKRLAPITAARWNTLDERVDLNATRDQILNATETPRDLSTIANTDRLSAIYRNYGVEWSDKSRDDADRRSTPGARPDKTPGQQRPTDPNRPGN